MSNNTESDDGGVMQRITIRIPDALIDAMHQLPEKNSAIVRAALKHWLIEHEKVLTRKTDKYDTVLYEVL